MRKFIVSIDAGTTSNRSILFDLKGLPMIENVILKKEKGVQFVPKRRRVVCILNNERVEPKK